MLTCTTTGSILSILQFALSCVILEDTINSLSNTHPNVSRITPHLTSLIKEEVITKEAGDQDIHCKRLAILSA
jgi:hypothetical protein